MKDDGPVIDGEWHEVPSPPKKEPLLQRGWFWRLIALLAGPTILALWKTGHFG